jgi:hypothetical protein
MLVFVSGAYRSSEQYGVDNNIEAARKVGIALWEAGHTAFVPHLNTAHFEVDCKVTDADYLTGDLNILSRCDAVVMVPGWETSKGSVAEREYATKNDIPVYEYPVLPALNGTESERPVQCDAFRNTTGRMYRLHLIKNEDYSPANIQGTGEIGLVTRIWDKTARLLNLTGFKLRMKKTKFRKPKHPKNESVDGTYIDLANYGIIGMIYRAGAWGK